MSHGDIVECLLNGMANEGRARLENVANSPQPTNKWIGLIEKFLHIKRAGITTGGQLGDIGALAGAQLSGEAAAFNV